MPSAGPVCFKNSFISKTGGLCSPATLGPGVGVDETWRGDSRGARVAELTPASEVFEGWAPADSFGVSGGEPDGPGDAVGDVLGEGCEEGDGDGDVDGDGDGEGAGNVAAAC